MLNTILYARYLCSRDALGLKAEQPAGQARPATIGYLVYKIQLHLENKNAIKELFYQFTII